MAAVGGSGSSFLSFSKSGSRSRSRSRCTSSRLYGFKEMFQRAFENDDTLSKINPREGSIDSALFPAINEEEKEDTTSRRRRSRLHPELTETQRNWRLQKQRQQQLHPFLKEVQSEGSPAIIFAMDWFLTGIPDKDPSNDLFGMRINISSRDRKLGITVPDTPTVSNILIQFHPDHTCQCLSDTPLTTASAATATTSTTTTTTARLDSSMGEWKVSSSSSNDPIRHFLRFRIPCTGYTRTVETQGKIQNIYWRSPSSSKSSENVNNENQTRFKPSAAASIPSTSATSTVYRIEPGWIYGEATLKSSASLSTPQQRELLLWSDCTLKVEKSVGLWRAASIQLLPCGKFTAQRVASYTNNLE